MLHPVTWEKMTAELWTEYSSFYLFIGKKDIHWFSCSPFTPLACSSKTQLSFKNQAFLTWFMSDWFPLSLPLSPRFRAVYKIQFGHTWGAWHALASIWFRKIMAAIWAQVLGFLKELCSHQSSNLTEEKPGGGGGPPHHWWEVAT